MAKTTRKTSKTSEQFNNSFNAEITGTGDAENSEALLASMLADLCGDADTSEIVESADESLISETVAAIEKADANAAIYENDPTPATVSAADTPSTAEVSEKPAKKAKTPKEKKVKEPKEPRVTYVGNSGHIGTKVLAGKLGEKSNELLVLETADATLDSDTLKAKQDELLAEIDKLAKKVGEKSVMLFGWIKNGGSLNEVMKRAFTVLAKEGELTSGDKGNLQTNLREKYSLGTARSQANQMFMLFPALKITMKEKGRMIPNPDSLIFMKAKAELGL